VLSAIFNFKWQFARVKSQKAIINTLGTERRFSMDFKTITKNRLESQIDSEFHFIVAKDQTVTLTLISIEENTMPPMFSLSLIFKGPIDKVLSGGTYYYEHETLENASLFIKPFQKNNDAILYDVVVSRLNEED
jgi:hypothetical protein